MLLSTFLLEAVLISLSGVVAPGPVTAVTVSKGTKSPHAGVIIALGHEIVEIPFMVLVLYGFGEILKITYIKAIIGLLGGMVLFKMGLDLLKRIKLAKIDSSNDSHSPLMAGIILNSGQSLFSGLDGHHWFYSHFSVLYFWTAGFYFLYDSPLVL